MPPNLKTVLYDIQDAGEAIQRFTAKKTLEDYQDDEMLRAAVERKFQIIGETLVRMRQIDEDVLENIRDYRKIIGFRNILVHGYDALSDEIVWELCGASLALLLADVERLLAD